jgi:hypothetical protein
MFELIPGRIGQAALLILMLLAVLVSSRVALRRKMKARSIQGLEKLEEWIREAGKFGRCVFFSPGTGGVGSTDTLAALELLRYVSKLCVKGDVKLIVANADLNVHQATEEIVKNAYAEAQKSDKYTVDTVRYISGSVFAYAAGVMGLLRRERPALNIFVGLFSAESLEIAEAGRSEALHQFGGTSSIDQLPFFLATCDLTLLAGELYVAQSYLTNDLHDISWTVGQDAGKAIAIMLILMGIVLLSFGSNIILNLMNL